MTYLYCLVEADGKPSTARAPRGLPGTGPLRALPAADGLWLVAAAAREILENADDSLLDLVDNLLNRGVVVSGEVMLGLAGVDLVYLRLQAILCAADRVEPLR